MFFLSTFIARGAEGALARWMTAPAVLVRGGLAIALLAAAYPSASIVWRGDFRTPVDWLSEPDIAPMFEAAAFLNERCDETDWVLAHCMPERLNCHRATFSQMAVVEGQRGSPFYPYEIYKDRRVNQMTLSGVRYAVISKFTRRVGFRYPGVKGLLERTRAWPIVFQREGVIIRERAGEAEVSPLKSEAQTITP